MRKYYYIPLLLLASIIISCTKKKEVEVTKDFREKYVGTYILDFSHKRSYNTQITLDTTYKGGTFRISYDIKDTAEYTEYGNFWYKLPAIRVSKGNSTSIMQGLDSPNVGLWGIRDFYKNEVVIYDNGTGPGRYWNTGGFFIDNTTSGIDSVYIYHHYNSPHISYTQVYVGHRVK